ncbi:MAG: SCP2 sterol-binding domain-containing protein [Candidatus Thermoplasmatota archaeon]|jgi:putative sterol carrier protein|nr:SCP2 sterol-binding domain-containing protein [Candidatus Thermoplasmatota archaeon]
MVQFPSQEWIDQFKELLNKNADYEDAARTWEGDFLFLITPDGPITTPTAFWLDLWHGKCRDAKLLASPTEKSAAFTYEGTYGNWKKLIGKEIDPIKGLLGGQFKLRGAMMKVMRYTRAAKELVETATKIPTDFL